MKTIIENAYKYLIEASKLNPGPWVFHSKYVALAAKSIAQRLKIDYKKAEAFGYIHDIGRRFGRTDIKHTIDGYRFLINKGDIEAAKICLTHSFPTKNIEDFPGIIDCSPKDYKFIKDFINANEFDSYDRLIQLCDAIAFPKGFTIIERRLMNVAIRYGINDRTINRWKAFLKIQKNVEQELGESIYSILPGFNKNTCGVPLDIE